MGPMDLQARMTFGDGFTSHWIAQSHSAVAPSSFLASSQRSNRQIALGPLRPWPLVKTRYAPAPEYTIEKQNLDVCLNRRMKSSCS